MVGSLGAEKVLGDRFEVVRRIGAGGMGTVYEAYDRERRHRCAIKVLDDVGPRKILRFKNEFRSLADVSHPNLITLYELVAAGGAWLLVMEVIDGTDFLAHVRGSGGEAPVIQPEGLSRLRRALAQLVRGLGALHDAGIVHRDVKPSNVLVDGDGRVVVLDFGLVAPLEASVTDSGHSDIVGTAAYIAPEQAEPGPVTAASDLYSVGVILYQALTGEAPFGGDALEALIAKTTADPPPPRALAPGVPSDLDALCVRLLDRDSSRRPTAPEILEALGAPLAAVAPHEVTPRPRLGVPVVGRAREIALLEGALTAVRARGRAVTVRMFGPSGMGKTTLLAAFLERAVASEALVLRGRCFERETVPYRAVDSLVDALSSHLLSLPEWRQEALVPADAAALGRLFPVLRRVPVIAAQDPPLEGGDPRELRRRAVVALREILVRLAAEVTLVCAIDDIQWADADSVAVLTELTAGTGAPPAMLLVLCARGADRAAVPETIGSGDRRDLAVGNLDDEPARELAAAITGDAAIAATVAREAGGNPLFVHQLASHVAAAGELGEHTTFERVVAARLGELDPAARHLLEILAVAGGPVAIGDAEAASELAGRGQATIAVLRANHWLSASGARADDQVEIYHDRIGRAVVAQLPAAHVAAAHRRLAVAMEASGRGDAEALALHWRAAGDEAQAEAHTRAAADRAAHALAFDRAARLYSECLALRPPPREAFLLEVRLGEVLAYAGRGAEAASAFLSAIEHARNAHEATELRRRAAEALLSSGHIDEGLEVLRAVLASSGIAMPKTPRGVLASLLWLRARLKVRGLGFTLRDASEIAVDELAAIDALWSAASGLGHVDVIRATELQTRGLLRALRAGERFRVCRGLAGESIVRATSGGADDRHCAAILETAETLARETGEAHADALVRMGRAYNAFLRGRWRECARVARRTVVILRDRCVGVRWELTSTRHLFLWSLVYLGDFAELATRVPPLLHDAEERGDMYAATNVRAGMINLAWLAGGDTAVARAHIDRADAQWTARGFHVQHYNVMLATAQLELFRGDAAAARRAVTGRWKELRASLLLRTQQIRIEALCLRARTAVAVAASDDAPAAVLRAARHDARRIAREKMLWSAGLPRAIEAGAAHIEGRDGAAERHLVAAERAFTEADLKLHAEACRFQRGALLGGAEGAELQTSADLAMRAEGIADPERWAAMLVPGFE